MSFVSKLKADIKVIYTQNKTLINFVLRVALIYFGWKLLFLLLGEEKVPIDERVWPWLSNIWESFNDSVRIILLKITQTWFDAKGMETEIINNYRLWVKDYALLGVGNYCLAIQLWIFFVALIVSYSGKWYNKLWFSILGVLLINAINVVRLIVVVYAAHRNPDLVQFNHDYVYNVVIYIFTFFTWVIWVKYFSDTNKKKIKSNEET